MSASAHVTGLRGTQWAKASEERDMSSVIVLLADKPKEELDDLVDELRRETGLEIMAREGRPYSLDDLDLVSAADAGTIVIMDPGHHLHGQVRRCQRLHDYSVRPRIARLRRPAAAHCCCMSVRLPELVAAATTTWSSPDHKRYYPLTAGLHCRRRPRCSRLRRRS